MKLDMYCGFWWPGSYEKTSRKLFGKLRKSVEFKPRGFLGLGWHKYVDILEPYDTVALERIFYNFLVRSYRGCDRNHFTRITYGQAQPVQLDLNTLAGQELIAFTDHGFEVGPLPHANDLLNKGVDSSTMTPIPGGKLIQLMYIPHSNEWLTFVPFLGHNSFKSFRSGETCKLGDKAFKGRNIHECICDQMHKFNLPHFEITIPMPGKKFVLDYQDFVEYYNEYVAGFTDHDTVFMATEVGKFHEWINWNSMQITDQGIVPLKAYEIRLLDRNDPTRIEVTLDVDKMRFGRGRWTAQTKDQLGEMALDYLRGHYAKI